jgi:hypothetical protein
MANYAMMHGNKVVNIIVADNKEETETALNCKLIEIGPDNIAGPDWIYNEETGRFDRPVEPEVVVGDSTEVQ